MKEQKNIERLFQEKFKDFQATPPEDSWDTIASLLNEKKKKKRIVPFWLQLSGIAASLFIVGTLIWNYPTKKETLIQENTTTIVIEDIQNKTNSGIENTIITNLESNQNASKKNTYKENNYDIINNTNDLTRFKKNKKTNSTFSSVQNSNNNLVGNSKENNAKTNTRNDIKNKSNDGVINTVIKNSNEENLVANLYKKADDKITIDLGTIAAFFEEDNKESTVTSTTNTTLIRQTNSNTIITSTEIISKDSALVVKIAEGKNPLEELLVTKEDGKNEDEKEEKRNKWEISTNASPIYFNSLGEGSPLDQQFENNSKSYSTTLSYGIGGSYMLSNKVSIRTGINTINLSYNTNDISYQTKINSTVTNNVPTISRNSNGSNVTFSSMNAIQNALSEDVENVTLNNTGSIKQDLSFIEVPLELSYKILEKKKFGIEVIGGMSTLFLNNNSVSLISDGIEMNVGKANNLNNIHFSSNVGLGFKYSFWEAFSANFQPMLKYQINPFSENSGDFRPYFIGLNTGLSYQF
jgi:hypothetical protein